VCTPDQRQTIDLETGVQWQRLTRGTDAEVDFLFVVYEVGGASSASGKFVRHHGREYGIIQADGCGVLQAMVDAGDGDEDGAAIAT
jgi:hypothetical protein